MRSCAHRPHTYGVAKDQDASEFLVRNPTHLELTRLAALGT